MPMISVRLDCPGNTDAAWVFEDTDKMNTIKMVAIVLMVAGGLALVYGGFSYTKQTQQAKLGPIELSVNEQHTVNVPVWAGVGAMVLGGALLLVASNKT